MTIEPPETDEYGVLVHDLREGRRLVAAVEIVSPANKDRPKHRRAFVAMCAALIRARVALVIVDIVTNRQFNLYRDVMTFLDNPADESPEDGIYASACRALANGEGAWHFEAWEQPLAVGAALPTLPLWLTEDLAVPLDLESTYEATCRSLRIR